MTKSDICAIMTVPLLGLKRPEGYLLHTAVSPLIPMQHSKWGEVVRMWKEKLFKAVLTVIFAVVTALLLTIDAC